MSKLSFGAMLGLVALGPAVAAAATGTLDTGALTPQTTGSRTAMEVMNTGASARTPGGETPPPAAVEATPREAGQHNGGPSGRNRPRQ